jgi:AraC-like DNA-binding protein
MEPVLHNLASSQVILNYAAKLGVDVETCLSGTGITPGMFEDAEALITPEQEMRLIENLMLALPEVPALGFELGLQYNVATFGTWGFALRTSRNLREAVERAIRYIPLSTAYCVFATATEQDEYVITADPDGIPIQIRQFLLERDLGTAINLMRELKLAGQPVLRLDFSGASLPYAERIVDLSGTRVRFNSGRNALVMSSKEVMTPLPTFDVRQVRLLEDQCRQLMERRKIGGVAGQVRQLLLGDMGFVASLEEIAKSLALSPRSLRRKLDAEKSSFRAILEDSRYQLASQILESTEMKLDELAMHLGYADTPSFTRAFRRWKGISPGQYRTNSRVNPA